MKDNNMVKLIPILTGFLVILLFLIGFSLPFLIGEHVEPSDDVFIDTKPTGIGALLVGIVVVSAIMWGIDFKFNKKGGKLCK